MDSVGILFSPLDRGRMDAVFTCLSFAALLDDREDRLFVGEYLHLSVREKQQVLVRFVRLNDERLADVAHLCAAWAANAAFEMMISSGVSRS